MRRLTNFAIALAAAMMAYHYTLIRGRTRDGCFRAFRHNHWIGLAVFAGIVLDNLRIAPPVNFG